MAEPKKEKKKYGWRKLVSVLCNPWFWDFLWKKFLRLFYPTLIKPFCKAPDAKLIGLDGKTKIDLENNYIKKYSDMPLVLNFGSYN